MRKMRRAVPKVLAEMRRGVLLVNGSVVLTEAGLGVLTGAVSKGLCGFCVIETTSLYGGLFCASM
ncbi:MAG: hypothetical protein LBB49_00045 [Gracilibacteraceae bacterium]|nr:hypothetical protein [Gracilibacteraceae bacterium]